MTLLKTWKEKWNAHPTSGGIWTPVTWIEKKTKKAAANAWVRYICFLYLFAFLMMGYTLIQNNFVIPVSGDFVLQQIPFYFNGYDDLWKALTTGDFPLWDESGFLGVNNIGANAFYYLLNPFFLPVLLVPRALIPQAQAFMIITKMVLAGIAMKKLLEVFNVKEQTTYMIGTAYAFSGWALFYLWFNHFFEIAVLMPIFLLGIEHLLRKRNPVPLIFSIFLVGITNYFFLISFCFCGVLYAGFRYFQRFKEMSALNKAEKAGVVIHIVDVRVEIILKGIFAFAVGLLFTAMIVLPCFEVAMTNTRVANATYLTNLQLYSKNFFKAITSFNIETIKSSFKPLWDLLFVWSYNRDKLLMYPLMSFFFPTVTDYDSILFVNDYCDYALSSLFLYTPLMLFFIPSFLQLVREKKFSVFIGIAGILVLLLTPFAYYCFSGFTAHAYGRWQIFVVAIACIFIGTQYDKRKQMPRAFLDISLLFTMTMCLFLLSESNRLADPSLGMGTKEMDDRIYIAYLYIVYIPILWFYIRKNFKKDKLTENLMYIIGFEAVVMCNIILQIQGTTPYSNLYGGQQNINSEIQLIQKVQEQDDSFYRVFSTTANRDGNNLAMMYGSRGIGAFHSIYNYNLNDFIRWSQIAYTSGSWSMGVHEKRVLLDTYLNVKYYVLKAEDTNIPFGFEEYLSTDTHRVYRNKHHQELGFSYDTLFRDSLNSSYDVQRTELGYLTGASLAAEDVVTLLDENPEFSLLSSFTDGKIASKYHSVPSSQEKLKIYKAKWENNQFIGLEPSNSLYGLTWNSRVDVTFTDAAKVCSEASEENPCYVNLKARMGENLSIALYGTDDNGHKKLLTSDRHMTHWYGKGSDVKTQRGFYVKDEVTSIEITVYDTFDTNRTLLQPTLEYMYYDEYKAVLDPFTKYSLENVQTGNDRYSFETNYDQKRFVVLNIPFDNGWTLLQKRNDTNQTVEVKKWMANGGFIGFIAPEGDYQYEMVYMTPGLPEGLKLTLVGMTLLSFYYVGRELLSETNTRRKAMYALGYKRN